MFEQLQKSRSYKQFDLIKNERYFVQLAADFK